MLDHFHIRGFRGYSETHLPIATRTAIIGGNGSGKTHILEAIHLASCGSIHYIQAPRYEDALFEMIYTHDIGPKSYSRERREKKDIFSIQGAKVTGIKYQENLPFRSVFISPFDMNLFYFAPGFRRDFVDSILERSFAQFRKTRRDYEMILRQRNALLKKIREGEAKKTDLTYWNKVFIEQAEVYHLYRMRWHTFVMRHLENITHLLGKYEILYVLESKIEEQEKKPENTSDRATLIGSYLDENLERDILTGHTHIWPHLDDFHFEVRKKWSTEPFMESALFFSRWENKVLLLWLKELEIQFLKKYSEMPIILLFDDLFAELDFSYAEEIIQSFWAEQVIITTQRPLPEGKNWSQFSCINLNTEYDAKNPY